MSWKDRAVSADAPAASGGWRSRAIPADSQDTPYQPTFLENAGEKVGNAVDTVMTPLARASDFVARKFSQAATGSEVPADLAEKGLGAVASGIENAGGWVADRLGRMGVNPYIGGAAGFITANAPYLLAPEAKTGISGRDLIAPVIPAERQAALAAAERMGLNPTFAEKTGSRFAAGLENTLEKTPLGAGPLEDRTAFNNAKLAEEAKRLSGTMGTQADAFPIGQAAQAGQASRQAAMNAQREALFSQIPDHVTIPLDEYKKMGDTIMQNQKEIRPIARNATVSSFAEDAQTPYGSTGAGVTGGPEVQGINKPEGPGVQYSASPETAFAPKSNYADVKALRETLTGKITEAHNAGRFNEERNLTLLKKSLDKDIENFVSAKSGDLPVVDKGIPGDPYALFIGNNDYGPEGKVAQYTVYGDHPRSGSTFPKTEIDKMGIPIKGREARVPEGTRPALSPMDALTEEDQARFGSTYRKANAFSGAYKELFGSDEAKALANTPPEKVVDSVFKRNNETAIKKFRAIVGEDAFQQAKRKFTQDIIQSPNVANELSKYEPGTLRAIYTEPELNQLRDYGSVQRITKTVPNLQGTAGSARANVSAASYTGLGAGILGLFTGNIPAAAAGIGSFVLPRPAANLYLRAGEGMLNTGVSRGTVDAGRRAALAAFINGRKKRQ